MYLDADRDRLSIQHFLPAVTHKPPLLSSWSAQQDGQLIEYSSSDSFGQLPFKNLDHFEVACRELETLLPPQKRNTPSPIRRL